MGRSDGANAGDASANFGGTRLVPANGDGQQNRRADQSEQVFFILLRIFNPMSLAMFLFFFGLSGALVLLRLPGAGTVSLVAAGTAGVFLSMQMQNLLGWFASKLETTGSFSLDDAVGAIGEITTTAPAGRVGEAIFVIGGVRRNYPVKSVNFNESLPRGTRVVFIAAENRLVFVEKFQEFIDQM